MHTSIAAGRVYRICGLNVATDLELPGATLSDEIETLPDAQVIREPVPGSLDDATRRGPNWEFSRDRLLLSVPGVARFLVSDGTRVSFDPFPGGTDQDLAIFVTGTVMGALLHQRGRFVLHASAVRTPRGAAVFCGNSGAGKSSLAAALSVAGYPLVADDVCCIEFIDHQPMVIPDGRRLKLWADALAQLSMENRRGAAVRPGIEKYWTDAPTPGWKDPVPLDAVYFLREARLPGQAGIEPASRLEAVEFLRANAYRPRLVREFGQEQAWLETCVAILERAAAWHLWRRLSYAALPDCLERLESHWRQ